MRKIAPLGRWLRLAVILGALGSVAVAGADVTWRLMGHDRVMPPVAVLRAPKAVWDPPPPKAPPPERSPSPISSTPSKPSAAPSSSRPTKSWTLGSPSKPLALR